jgi:hypothetical protein
MPSERSGQRQFGRGLTSFGGSGRRSRRGIGKVLSNSKALGVELDI